MAMMVPWGSMRNEWRGPLSCFHSLRSWRLSPQWNCVASLRWSMRHSWPKTAWLRSVLMAMCVKPALAASLSWLMLAMRDSGCVESQKVTSTQLPRSCCSESVVSALLTVKLGAMLPTDDSAGLQLPEVANKMKSANAVKEITLLMFINCELSSKRRLLCENHTRTVVFADFRRSPAAAGQGLCTRRARNGLQRYE